MQKTTSCQHCKAGYRFSSITKTETLFVFPKRFFSFMRAPYTFCVCVYIVKHLLVHWRYAGTVVWQYLPHLKTYFHDDCRLFLRSAPARARPNDDVKAGPDGTFYLEVPIDSTTRLECHRSGTPTPETVWTKEGKVSHTGDPFYSFQMFSARTSHSYHIFLG